MRIGLVIYGRLDTLTGGYLYDRQLVEALRARGHRVEVIPLSVKPYALRLLDNLSDRRAGLPAGRSWDLILQDGLCHPSLIGLNRRIRAARGPVLVAIVHQVLCRQPHARGLATAYGWVEKTYFRTLDGFLFTSRFNRDAARPLIGRQAPLAVVPPAGDRLGRIPSDRDILERSRRPGPLELLFVGNLSPVKGLDRLLESLAPLPFATWRLTVVGSLTTDSGHTRRIRDQISSRGLGSQVDLAGPVDGETLRARYLAAHLFVMPFAHEGFGIAALEAMAFGLPVIGSAEGGVGEFVRPAQNGHLVAARDHAAVRRHIEGLHADRDQLAAMGRAALQTFAARPSWAEAMRRGCGVLERMAAAAQRPQDPRGVRRS
jgi:glycosyltransferase involved in cell wall biosynthesis